MSSPSEAAAEWVPTGALRPWANNPRKNDAAVGKVAESIKRFGFGAPIIARRENNEIIAGHTRWKAAQKLGIDRVPVRFLDLDPADAKLLALADNKVGEVAEWDETMLGAVLEELRAQGEDLLLGTGFDQSEIDRLIAEAHGIDEPAEDPGAQVDRASELQSKWGTALGQLWIVPSASVAGGDHRLLCGDSRKLDDARRAIGSEKASWCWTDPPYGVSYVGKTEDALTIKNDGAGDLPALLKDVFACVAAVCEPSSPYYMAHPAGALSLVFGDAIRAAGWRLHQTLVWVKDSMVLGHSDYHYQHEPIFYGYLPGNGRPGRGDHAGSRWHGDNAQKSVLAVDRPKRSELHPTMKPPELVVRCLVNSSAPGSIGFEPFNGSGTTMVAAEQCGRLCRGIELDPRFVAVALERLAGMGLEPRLEQ